MAVPFGLSVGDFIAGINVIITSINAINDATGSSAEYRAVIGTLCGIKSALEDLNRLKIEDLSQRHALEILASRCGETIFAFTNKISKYKTSFESPTSSPK